MSINLQLPKLTDLEPRLTVVGVGGAGCNAVNNMIAAGLTGVEFVVANTDAQALAASSAEYRIQLGVNLTEGLGAGARPEIGQAAAEEAVDEIRTQVSGSHMVFLAAGMGGGTGTGAASVIARVAREQGILVVGVVTKPFQFEGSRRMRVAEAGVEELKACVDTLIVIPNQNLFRIASEKTTFAEAFVLADHVLYSGVACIVDLIIKEGLINLDFADVRSVMSGMGTAMMGTGQASGEHRATVAAEEAITNPLLDDISLQGAKGLLLSITGGRDLTLFEVDEAASRVRQEVDPEATIIVGATFDETLDEKIRVSIVASGMERLSDRGVGSGGFMGLQPQPQMPHQQQAPASAAPPLAPAPTTDPAVYGAVHGAPAFEPVDPQGAGVGNGYGELSNLEGTQGPSDFLENTSGFEAPPPVPFDQSQVLQQRLADAIQPGASNAAGGDPSVDGSWGDSNASPAPLGGNGNEMPARYSGEPTGQYGQQIQGEGPAPQWQGPSGVMIEEGLPPNVRRMPAGASPFNAPIAPVDPTISAAAVQFNPEQPPADVRRPARRMPAVEDFPVVGQREYRARLGGQVDGSQVPVHREQVPPQHTAQHPQQQRPNRKKGLFERLTGIGRKQSDSFSEAQNAPSSAGNIASSYANPQYSGQVQHDVRDNNADVTISSQASELPEFF